MFVAYQVCKITLGKPQGVLNLSYKLREVTQAAGANSYAPAQSAYTEAPPAAAYPPPTYRKRPVKPAMESKIVKAAGKI